MSGGDLVCLSHLRWGFVFQRPNHLMSRFARERRTFFVEEPIYGDGPPRMEVQREDHGVVRDQAATRHAVTAWGSPC